MLGAADLENFFHANRGLFHTTDMASKCFLSSAQVAFWISSLMIRAFQTGNDSCTALMCLQYVIKYQNHSDTSQFHMSLMSFPIYFNAFFCPGVRNRSRSRSRPESWQRARSRSRSNCLDSDSGTFCLNL